MSYQKPDGLLLSQPVKRKTPKSAFLKKLERSQQNEVDAAHILLQNEQIARDNQKRKVTNLSIAFARRRDK
jgi:hypothetical protein